MLNRIYLQTNKEYDSISRALRDDIYKKSGVMLPDLTIREIVELRGEVSEEALSALRYALYSPFCETVSNKRNPLETAITVMLRTGRSDERVTEIKDILRLYTDIDNITVRVGKEYNFSKKLNQKQHRTAIKYLRNIVTEVVPNDESVEEAAPSENQIAYGFNSDDYTALAEFKEKYGLEMDIDDMMCLQNYFLSESREPSFAEIYIIDRFFSEGFRHTTFETILDRVECNDPVIKTAWNHYRANSKSNAPSLSDMSRVATEYIKFSETVNDSPKMRGIKITDDNSTNLLLMLKNESRNRSVTIEPYSGAACSLGSTVRGILCRLGYVYDTYRVSGVPFSASSSFNSEQALMGYADFSAKTGIPCSRNSQIISDSYMDKQLEICACLAVSDLDLLSALNSSHASPGDYIFIIGGETGKDGPLCMLLPDEDTSTDLQGEYIPVAQPGILNALCRLFIRRDAISMITALNHVGSGGIACAIGEIVDGVTIQAQNVPLKYPGLSVSEILLSASQERMVVCVSPENANAFEMICKEENILCANIATADDSERFTVYSGKERIISLTREFLVSGGTEKHLSATIEKSAPIPKSTPLAVARSVQERKGALKKLFNKDSKYDFVGGIMEAAKYSEPINSLENLRFDETAGGNILFPPFSAKIPDAAVRYINYRGKPVISNGQKLCSALGFGVNPEISFADPYRGAYLSVTEAKMKLVASGYGSSHSYVSLQEYLPEHRNSSKQLGISVAAMLGAHEAQTSLNIASLGGKLSLATAGNDYKKHSTVAAFTTCIGTNETVITRDFKKVGHRVILLKPEYEKSDVLPIPESQLSIIETFNSLVKENKIKAATSLTAKCPATAILEMCRASGFGFEFDLDRTPEQIFDNCYGSIIAEISNNTDTPKNALYLGKITENYTLTYQKDTISIDDVPSGIDITSPISSDDDPEELSNDAHENEPLDTEIAETAIGTTNHKNFIYLKENNDSYGNVPTVSGNKVNVVIPISKHNSGIYDIKRLFEAEGATVELIAYDDDQLTMLSKAIDNADILYLADSTGYPAYMNAVFCRKTILNKLSKLRNRGALIYAEGSGVETLISTGLLEVDKSRIGLCKNPIDGLFNATAKIRSTSTLSPFMRLSEAGEYYDTVITGKRLRLLGDPEYINALAFSGRIAAQYPEDQNPLGNTFSVDALTSADGRVFGQISRPERLISAKGDINILPVIRSAVRYFKTTKA